MTDNSFETNKQFTVQQSDYTTSEAELVELFEKAAIFTPLKAVETPPAADLSADRQAFLDQVAYYRQRSTSALPAPAISTGARLRNWLMDLVGWNGSFKKKEKKTMTTLLVRMAVIIAAIMGAAGTTAVAANNSLPDSPLYPIKLAMEDTELALTTDKSAEAELHIRLAEARIDEMERLALQSRIVNDEQVARLQTHLASALRLMATVPESNMNGILLRAQQMAQTRTRSMSQTRENAPEAIQTPLGDAYQLMHQFGQEVEQGLANPVLFRQRHTNNRPDSAPEQPNNEPFGPNRPITPTQHLSPGPNNCINEDCVPAGNALQQGPAAGNCADGEACEPINNANHYGNTEEDPPYGNRNGTESDPPGAMEQNRLQQPPDAPNYGQPDSSGTGCPNTNCNNGDGSGSLEQNRYDPGPYGPGPDQPGPGDVACITETPCNSSENRYRNSQ